VTLPSVAVAVALWRLWDGCLVDVAVADAGGEARVSVLFARTEGAWLGELGAALKGLVMRFFTVFDAVLLIHVHKKLCKFRSDQSISQFFFVCYLLFFMAK
jgi:hypothetical protein